MWKQKPSQFPKARSDVILVLILSDQLLKTKLFSIYVYYDVLIMQDSEKQLTLRTENMKTAILLESNISIKATIISPLQLTIHYQLFCWLFQLN